MSLDGNEGKLLCEILVFEREKNHFELSACSGCLAEMKLCPRIPVYHISRWGSKAIIKSLQLMYSCQKRQIDKGDIYTLDHG